MTAAQITTRHYSSLLTELAQKNDVDVSRLLNDSGLKKNDIGTDQQWIDNGLVAEMVKAIWRSGDDEFFGLTDKKVRIGTWAIGCQHMLMAETLGELFRLGNQILSFLPPDSMQIRHLLNEQRCDVTIECYQGQNDPARFLTEFIAVTWHRFPCWAIDQYIPLQEARFSYPAPDHHWFYEELFQCPILFDQAETGFSFDAKYLASPVSRNRSELESWLKNSPADLLYLPGRDSTISSHVRKQLDMSLRETMRFPAFDDICAQLNMSNQVVRRRLKEEGENYQNLKDTVRLDLIKELLLHSELSLAEVTDRAGFKEVASLSRAFKKWTDTTPAEYRKNYTSPKT